VWRRNMIMRDRETGTLWQHATGEALIGPLQGARLNFLGGELITWAGWKKAHPHTLAALEPAEWGGMLSRERVMPLLEKATSLIAGIAPGKTQNDKRLPAHETVVGISVDGEARAYRLVDLQQVSIIEESFNNRNIRVEYDATSSLVRAFADGSSLIIQRTWWLGWYEFHPETTIFGA